jgi:hypothetical protein
LGFAARSANMPETSPRESAMRAKVPYVYEAYVAPSREADSHRAMILAAAELDLPEVPPAEMREAMTYRTLAGPTRTLKTFGGFFFEAAFDLSHPARFRDARAGEANFNRRHGFLGTADRRGRCMTEESLGRFSFQVDSTDRERTLRDVAAHAGDHVVADGRVWIRVPEPVLAVQSYDVEAEPSLAHHLRAQGAPGKKGVFVSIKSADPRQNSDGIARMNSEAVFNIRELDRAKAYAGQIAPLFETTAHVSIEAETRRLLEPFLFRFDRRQAVLNAELAEIAEHHLDRFSAHEIRHASEEAIGRWVDLRRAYDAATSAPYSHRETLTPFQMDPAKMGGLVAPLKAFAEAAPGLDKGEVRAVLQTLERWPQPEEVPAMRP